MCSVPLPLRRGFLWHPTIIALAAAALLSGCANGDFQEVRPTLVRDDIHDWVGRDAVTAQGAKPSRYELTDDERALRDLAYPLIEPPYDRHQWYSIAGEYGVIRAGHRGAFDRSAYAIHLMGARYRSSSARYAQLADDIRNDTTRLPEFFDTAARVLDIDAKRRRSLAFLAPVSAVERENALRRINENVSIVAMVQRSLSERVASYRYALGRLVLATPSARAADIDRDVKNLQARIAYYRVHRLPGVVREQSLAWTR